MKHVNEMGMDARRLVVPLLLTIALSGCAGMFRHSNGFPAAVAVEGVPQVCAASRAQPAVPPTTIEAQR